MELNAGEYKQKYPREGEEFMTLLQCGLSSDWESALPRISISDPVDATHGYSEKCLNQIAKGVTLCLFQLRKILINLK